MIIIHGDNNLASREFFLAQKKLAYLNFLDLAGEDLTYAQLVQFTSTPDLFGQYPVIFIENFFSRRPSNEKKKILEFIKTIENENKDLYFYDSKDVSAQIKSINVKNIKYFSHPKYIYSFLETFSISALQSCLQVDPPELILGALAKHLHNLILIKENSGVLPSWQAGKLRPQAAKFSLSSLINLSQSLLKIDYHQKTSSTPQDLASALELWCLKV